mmetsp:Transcript_6122/g.15953  ORF Transcript_6122/g.15953 Transcript_6122/m.15953 type:complete len:88 (-) Transcript_6122:246-509(-)
MRVPSPATGTSRGVSRRATAEQRNVEHVRGVQSKWKSLSIDDGEMAVAAVVAIASNFLGEGELRESDGNFCVLRLVTEDGEARPDSW